MINFTGAYALKSVDTLTAMTSLSTYYFHIYPTQVTTRANIYYLPIQYGFYIYIESSKLYVVHSGKYDDGTWSCPLTTANQHYQIALTYTGTADNTTAPVIWINGVKQTVTYEVVPDTSKIFSTDYFYIGGTSNIASTNAFTGAIGEFAFFRGTGLSDAIMQQLTSSRKMGMPLQYSTCTNYFAMDSLPTVSTLVPNSDIAYTWITAAPAWSKINAQDGTIIKADKNDDGETVEFGMTTATITGSVHGVSIQTYAYIDDTSIQATLSVYMASAYQTYQGLGNTGTSYETRYHNFYPAYGTFWSQTDVDNMQVALKAAATIGKSQENNFDYVAALVFHGSPITDRKEQIRMASLNQSLYVNNYLSY